MYLPYGIDEQYIFLESFLNSSPTQSVLHIRESYCETPAILAVVLQLWEQQHGSSNVRIRYLESDSAIKRIVTNKRTGEMKTIILDIPYSLGWELYYYKKQQIVTAVRLGTHMII